MSTAIYLENARNVLLKNVWIRGFNTGIVAKNSDFLADNIQLSNNLVGIYAENSFATLYRCYFNNNAIDIIANRSSIHQIDTIAKKILEIPNYSQRYEFLELSQISERILKTSDPKTKKELFKKLLIKIIRFSKSPIVKQVLAGTLSGLLSGLALKILLG